RLHDVVLEDGGAPQLLQQRNRKHRDRNRGGDGQACLERQVDGRSSENQPEQDADEDRLRRELRDDRLVGDVRLVGGGGVVVGHQNSPEARPRRELLTFV